MSTTNSLPIDANGEAMQLTPSKLAVAVTYDATISGSTTVTLNALTTYIEVTSLLKGTFMKWGATASSTTFDEFITPESTRAYVVPVGQTSVQFIEEAASAHLIVIEK